MKNTNTMQLSAEVTVALQKYNTQVQQALTAVQKLESIAITARLAKLFHSNDMQAAQALKQDYLVGV